MNRTHTQEHVNHAAQAIDRAAELLNGEAPEGLVEASRKQSAAIFERLVADAGEALLRRSWAELYQPLGLNRWQLLRVDAGRSRCTDGCCVELETTWRHAHLDELADELSEEEQADVYDIVTRQMATIQDDAPHLLTREGRAAIAEFVQGLMDAAEAGPRDPGTFWLEAGATWALLRRAYLGAD